MKSKYKLFFFVLFVLIVADTYAIFRYYQTLMQQQPYPVKGESGLIFFCDFDRTGKSLGSDSLRRIHHALSLYRKGEVQKLVCLGGIREGRKAYGARLMRNYLIREGVNEEDVFHEERSYDSQSNWDEAKMIIKQQQWKSVVVISSPLHILRLERLITEQMDPGLAVSFSAYIPAKSIPAYSFSDALWQVYYERVAVIAALLPESTYRNLIKQFRRE